MKLEIGDRVKRGPKWIFGRDLLECYPLFGGVHLIETATIMKKIAELLINNLVEFDYMVNHGNEIIISDEISTRIFLEKGTYKFYYEGEKVLSTNDDLEEVLKRLNKVILIERLN
jgi:hypothetical protein